MSQFYKIIASVFVILWGKTTSENNVVGKGWEGVVDKRQGGAPLTI